MFSNFFVINMFQTIFMSSLIICNIFKNQFSSNHHQKLFGLAVLLQWLYHWVWQTLYWLIFWLHRPGLWSSLILSSAPVFAASSILSWVSLEKSRLVVWVILAFWLNIDYENTIGVAGVWKFWQNFEQFIYSSPSALKSASHCCQQCVSTCSSEI